jgi:hypothetical protein
MTIGFLFWLIMVLWFLFGIYRNVAPTPPAWPLFGDVLILFILFLLLGIQVFGWPIRT